MKSAVQGGRIPSIDGWRAISIALVLGHHMPYSGGFPYSQSWWINIIFDGNLGVRIFFVISGFLITYLLLEEAKKNGNVSLWNFYVRRIFRIFPIYFTYLGVLGLLTVLGFYKDALTSWIGSLTFTRNMIGRGDSATVHLWSLAIEEQFYLVWPLTFAICKLWKHKYLYFALLSIPIALCPLIRAYFPSGVMGGTLLDRVFGERSILNYADSLAIGCIGAWFFSRNLCIAKSNFSCQVMIIVSIVALIYGQWLMHYSTLSTHGLFAALIPSVQAVATLALLLLTSSPASSLLFRLLNSKGLVALGILSYSVYIWHMMFLCHFMGKGFESLLVYDWKIWLLPTILTSIFSYFFLETPFSKMSKKFRDQ